MRGRGTMPARRLYWAALAAVLAFAAFCAFWGLDAAPVADWDEARHGVNAFEMFQRGDWLVNTYRWAPDYWNLKPPLSFWAIMAGFRLFGATVLALRFYSAVSVFLTVLLAALFLYRRYGRAACLCGAALLSCQTLLYRFHYGRSGDADALFGLLCTVCVLVLFLAQQNPRWLLLSGFAFSLAFLDKSWHALVLLLIAGLFLLLTGRLFRLGARIWVGMLACMLLPVGAWAAARYHADGARFFVGMVERDLLARSSTPLEGHSGGAFYYAALLCGGGLGILALAAALAWLARSAAHRRTGAQAFHPARQGRLRALWPRGVPARADGLLFALWALVPLVLFSAAATKYSWYIFPTVVPLCMLCGVAVQKLGAGEKGAFWLRAASCAGVALVVALNAAHTVPVVLAAQPAQVQLFLRGSAVQAVRGRTAYIQWTAGGDWSQSEVFVAEAYVGLRCEDGGLAGFLRQPDSVAVVDARIWDKAGLSPAGTVVLSRADGYVLLAHASSEG